MGPQPRFRYMGVCSELIEQSACVPLLLQAGSYQAWLYKELAPRISDRVPEPTGAPMIFERYLCWCTAEHSSAHTHLDSMPDFSGKLNTETNKAVHVCCMRVLQPQQRCNGSGTQSDH